LNVAKESASEVLSLEGREVQITNPEKLYFSQARISKLDLVRYYLAVTPGDLARIRHRPVILKRYVDGGDA
jgi:DNA primase